MGLLVQIFGGNGKGKAKTSKKTTKAPKQKKAKTTKFSDAEKRAYNMGRGVRESGANPKNTPKFRTKKEEQSYNNGLNGVML